MTPVSPLNKVFCKFDAFDEEVKTSNGVKLYKDTTYNPEWSATVSAEAISIPAQVRQADHDTQGIKEFVKQHDTILFRYLVVMQITQEDNATRYHNQHFIDGEVYWKVDYSMILGVLRNGELIPAPGYIFAKQIEKKKEEKVGILYLPEMIKSEVVKGKAVVEYVGEPKTNAIDLGVTKGDTIVFPDRLAEKYEVNGEKFLVIRQEYVQAKEV